MCVCVPQKLDKKPENKSNMTPKTTGLLHLVRRGMHECMTARMSTSACMMSSPVPHPRTRTHPILNHEGSATRRAASRSLTSLRPSRYRRRSGLHFSRKRNSFLTVFPPSRSLSPPCRTYMRSRHGLGIIQSSDKLQYAKNEEHFLRPPLRRRSRHQQRVDAG